MLRERKLDCLRSLEIGTYLRKMSYAIELGNKTYRFKHRFKDALMGICMAVGEIIYDRTQNDSHWAVPLPSELAIAGR